MTYPPGEASQAGRCDDDFDVPPAEQSLRLEREPRRQRARAPLDRRERAALDERRGGARVRWKSDTTT